MHTIQTQVQISRDRILSILLPEDMAEGTYQVVIVMNAQPANQLDEDDTPDEVAIEGIKEGFQEALTNQIIPLSQMWQGIDVE